MALQITTRSLPIGVVGQMYNQPLEAAGSAGSITWSVDPSLPAGLTLDKATGVIQGTPESVCVKTPYKFTATDGTSSGNCCLLLEVATNADSTRNIPLLAAYLLGSSLLLGFLIYSLWSSRPPVVPVSPPDCRSASKPALRSIYPARLDAGSGTGILIQGCQFTQKTQVKLNGIERAGAFIDPSHVRVLPSAADVVTPGPVVITMFAEDGTQFGSDTLWVTQPDFYWGVFGFAPWPISKEMQLLLLVLCTGAFASSVYAMKSLADYKGNGRFSATWSLYYLKQPIEGAGIAFLFYVAIRGGFLTGGGGDASAVNQFGMCAIAGLAGAFSDMAFMKLREVFQTLFKPQDDRGNKISGFKITSTSLSDGEVNKVYDQTLQASGGSGSLSWSVTPPLPSALVLDAASGKIHGTPASPLASTNFTFKVTDSSNPPLSATAMIALKINQ